MAERWADYCRGHLGQLEIQILLDRVQGIFFFFGGSFPSNSFPNLRNKLRDVCHCLAFMLGTYTPLPGKRNGTGLYSKPIGAASPKTVVLSEQAAWLSIILGGGGRAFALQDQ